ncbi:MAG: glycosyl hydrolase family 18 protein, partial [Actinomycetes bacterium]
LPYWTTAQSNASFLANADLFSDISPFWHDAVKNTGTASGVAIASHALGSGSIASNLAALKGRGAKILPSITDGTGAGVMAGVVKSPAKRAAFVGQIVGLVNGNGYDGIDLDFEKFAFSDAKSTWAATRPAWVQFVADLANALHASGKQLALAVPPMYSDTTGYWVYDFRGVAPYVDRLRIMAYDYSYGSAGPVGGPISWVDGLVKYAVSVVPASKVVLGSPTYGRDWVTASSPAGCASAQRVYDSNQMGSAIPEAPLSKWVRDPASLEMHVTYKTTTNGGACKVTRSAWMADTTTTVERAKLADRYGLAGTANWTIGAEDPSLWPAMRVLAGGVPRKAQVVSALLSKTLVRKGAKVRIRGSIGPARAGVTISLQRYRSGKWIFAQKVKTNAAGFYSMAIRTSSKVARYRVKAAVGGGYSLAYSPTVVLRTK